MEKLLAEKTLLGKKLGEILVSLGKISQEQLERAILARPKDRMRIGEYLIQKGLIEEDDLLEALSKQLGLEYRKTLIGTGTNIESFTLSRQFVKKFYAIILKEGEDFVELALNDPLNIELIENIKSLTGKKTHLVLAKKIEIIKLADILAGESAESADDVLEDLDEEVDGFQVLSEESLSEPDVLDMANEAPIIKLVNLIITEALKQRASDIHIEPSEHSVTVRYRIDGMLHTVLNPPKRYQQPIVSRIKIMANLNIAENRLPQDGRIKVKYGASDIDIRVSIVPSVAGERVVMRLLRKEASSYQLEKLGMNKNILNDFRETLSIPHGIIIVSGPTGSGKTTTLYAAIREINTP
ncbi:MAG: type II secretion system protein GspE, partial [Spirochaetes bacterium]